MATKSKTQPKKSKRPPTVTVFFSDDTTLQKQIVQDAEVIGISVSSLARMALEIGYPEVRRHFNNIKLLPEVESK